MTRRLNIHNINLRMSTSSKGLTHDVTMKITDGTECPQLLLPGSPNIQISDLSTTQGRDLDNEKVKVQGRVDFSMMPPNIQISASSPTRDLSDGYEEVKVHRHVDISTKSQWLEVPSLTPSGFTARAGLLARMPGTCSTL